MTNKKACVPEKKVHCTCGLAELKYGPYLVKGNVNILGGLKQEPVL